MYWFILQEQNIETRFQNCQITTIQAVASFYLPP